MTPTPPKQPQRVISREMKLELIDFAIAVREQGGPGAETWANLSQLMERVLETYSTGIMLPKPKSRDAANQCRDMGIAVGDSIVGRENYGRIHSGLNPTGGWSDAHLTLVFLGSKIAVWQVWRRSSSNPDWIYDGEASNWTLTDREWMKMEQPPIIPSKLDIPIPEPKMSTVTRRADARALLRDEGGWSEKDVLEVIPPEAVCIGCGLVRGPAYPEEPSVKVRKDGKARCEDCNQKAKI